MLQHAANNLTILAARIFSAAALAMTLIAVSPNTARSVSWQYDAENHPVSGRYHIASEGGFEISNFQTNQNYARSDIKAQMFSYGIAFGYRMTVADILYNVGFSENWLHLHPEMMNAYLSAEAGFYTGASSENIRITVPAEDLYLHTDFTFEDKFRANLNLDAGYLVKNAFSVFGRIGYAFAHPEITLVTQFTSTTPQAARGNPADSTETLNDALAISDHAPSTTHYDKKMHGVVLGGGLEFIINRSVSLRILYSHNFAYHRSEHALRSGILWRF